MNFVTNPAIKSQIIADARKKLEMACADLVTYIKTVKLSKGRRGQGDVLNAGDPPYGGQANKLRNSVGQRWKDGDPNTQQVGSLVKSDTNGHKPDHSFVGLIQEVGAPGPGVKQPIGVHGLMTIALSDEAIKHRDGGGTARNFPKKLTMIPSTGRTGIFFLVETKKTWKNYIMTIHYVLAKSVRIPPHPWLVPSLNEHWPRMLKIMSS